MHPWGLGGEGHAPASVACVYRQAADECRSTKYIYYFSDIFVLVDAVHGNHSSVVTLNPT